MAGKESTPKRFSAPAYYLHTVVCLLIMFGFGQLPPVEPLTPLGMNLIGIFLGVLYGWVCIEIVWPSLAGLLAFVQPLSGAMAKPESGITSFLMMALDPIISGGTPLTFALFLGLAATLLTQVMNNGAVGVALMPIIYSYCQAANVSPELPLIMVVMGVHFAFLTPAASASAALLHGNEWSDSKAIWKTAPAVILMSYLVTAAITIIVGKAIF